MELKGSQTEKNLAEAFAGESQARNKYTYFASRAKKDGYEQIAELFTESAENEKEHAKIWFKLLHNNDVPATADALLIAAEGEKGEWTDMYKRFAETAKKEGFTDIARLFAGVGAIEQRHEERFRALLKNINDKRVFSRPSYPPTPKQTEWKCRNCGHTHVGNAAPTQCPVCSHPQSYFEIKQTNY